MSSNRDNDALYKMDAVLRGVRRLFYVTAVPAKFTGTHRSGGGTSPRANTPINKKRHRHTKCRYCRSRKEMGLGLEVGSWMVRVRGYGLEAAGWGFGVGD